MRGFIGILFLLLLMLFGVVLSGVAVWLLFWIANGIMWLLGIGADALISDLFMRDLGWFGRVVMYIVGFEWIYGLFFFMVLTQFANRMESREGADGITVLTGVVLCLTVICVYDPRIAPMLPGFIESGINFLQTSCAARLVGGVSMADMNFSGTITDPVYFTLFDVIIAGVTGLWAWGNLSNN